MRFRFLLNIFLLLVIAGLVIFLSRPTDDNANREILLTSKDPTTVQNIKIIRRDLDDIAFSKLDNHWRMQQPGDIAANEFRIKTILNLLTAHSYTQLDSNPSELHKFNLDNPVVAVEFDGTRISYGDVSPLEEGKLRYVLHDNKIHLINDSLYQQLLTNASFFISPRLLPENDNIEAITFPEYSVRRIDGIWKIFPEIKISADEIINTINAWRETKAITVRKYFARENEPTITVTMQQAQPIEFRIVSPLPNLVLARPGLSVQYHISSDEAKKLFLQDTTTEPSPDTPAVTPDQDQDIINN